jgi:hypothetical protein
MRDLTPPEKPNPDTGKKKYEPTERERTALDRYRAQKAAAPAAPRMTVTNDKKSPTIAPDHPDKPLAFALLMEALGTVSNDFTNGLLSQLANAGSHGRQIDEGALNFMLSVVKGIKPKDQLEAMLAAQMAAIHTTTMTFARRLAHVETIQQQDSAERALNKLARTFAMQMEALKRYRTGGEQKVTVQHVSVNEGGQAIVGNVNQAGGGSAPEKPVTTTPALTDARQQAMPIIETPGAGGIAADQEKRWRVITLVIQARCSVAGAAGRSRARASPAGRQRLLAKNAAGCTAAQRDQARRAATRMRSSMGAIRAKPSRSADSCEPCCGSRGH